MDERLIGGLAVREWGGSAGPSILLWPGLGSTSAYFALIADSLPGRVIAVDPPGFGRSRALDGYTFEALVELAASAAEACQCWAIVGHSLGANLVVGVAADPPPGLRAAVLLDGGFTDADGLAQLGMPIRAGREALIAWMQANELRFADWETAIGEMGRIIGSGPSAALEAYVRDVLVEVDGEIREAPSPDRLADLVLAVVDQDVVARAAQIRVPTLLIASGQPTERRADRERAWRRFADASALIELQVIDDWGHNAIVQDPAASTRLIAGWLEKHLQR